MVTLLDQKPQFYNLFKFYLTWWGIHSLFWDWTAEGAKFDLNQKTLESQTVRRNVKVWPFKWKLLFSVHSIGTACIITEESSGMTTQMKSLDECSWWVFILVLNRANFLSICFLLLFLDREMLPCSERLTFRHHWSHFSRHRLICRQFLISELPFISVSKSLRKAHAFIPTLHVNKTANFHIKGFTQALALKQRRKASENWAIPLIWLNQCNWEMCVDKID